MCTAQLNDKEGILLHSPHASLHMLIDIPNARTLDTHLKLCDNVSKKH